MNRRRLALLVGGSLLAAGLVFGLFEGLAESGPMAALAEPGTDYKLAAGVGGLIVLLGLGVVTARSLQGFEGASPPRREEIPDGTPAGAEIDRAVAGDLSVREHLAGDERVALRERLRSTTVETVARTERCRRPEARDRVDAGEWTHDPVAASFVAEVESDSIGARLVDALPGGSRFQRRADRTVEALLALTEGDR